MASVSVSILKSLRSRTREDGAKLTLKDGKAGRRAMGCESRRRGEFGPRKVLEIETEGPGDMGHFVNVMFRAPYGRHLRDRLAILYQALSEEYFEAFVAVNGDDRLVDASLPPAWGRTPRNIPKERFERDYPPGFRRFPDEPVGVISMRSWVMSPKVAMRFRVGRSLLVG